MAYTIGIICKKALVEKKKCLSIATCNIKFVDKQLYDLYSAALRKGRKRTFNRRVNLFHSVYETTNPASMLLPIYNREELLSAGRLNTLSVCVNLFQTSLFSEICSA
jgi:hypothetical protein